MLLFRILLLLLFNFVHISFGYVDKWFTKKPEVYPTIYMMKTYPALIPLPYHDTYRRIRTNKQDISYEHIYRVCTRYDDTDCGVWKNVKNNKTVPSGRTYFDHAIGKLFVEDFRGYDSAIYMTGDRKDSIGVFMVPH